MSLFDRIFKRYNNPETYAYRLKKAKALHGQVIKYVTERRDGNDDVVGKVGSLCIHGDNFIVSCTNVDRLFMCNIFHTDRRHRERNSNFSARHSFQSRKCKFYAFHRTSAGNGKHALFQERSCRSDSRKCPQG